jgi:hypothetical protein
VHTRCLIDPHLTVLNGRYGASRSYDCGQHVGPLRDGISKASIAPRPAHSRKIALHFRCFVIHDTHLRYTSVVRTTSLGKCVSTGYA